MANIEQYADLANPVSGNKNYSDLSQPMSNNSKYSDLMSPIKNTGWQGFINSLPSPKEFEKSISDPEFIKQQINLAAGGPSMKLISKGLKEIPNVISKSMQYINPQKTVNQFMNDIGYGKTSEENITDLAKRLSFARNSAAEEALQHKRPVFQTLGNRQIETIPEKTNYMSQSKSYKNFTGDLKEIHDNFADNPTLNNADALQQQLGNRIGKLKKLSYEGKLDRAGEDELSQLAKSRDHIMSDMDNFMASQDPINKAQYDLFRSKWRNNVTPYDESPILSEITRKGMKEGITPGEIKSIFSYPSAKVKKISEDIGPSGRKNILYNELQSETPLSALDLSDALKKSKQFGFQQYIDPKMEMLAKELPKRYKTSEIVKATGKGALGGLAGLPFGHPGLGMMIGAGLKPATQASKKIIEQFKK